MPGRSPLTPRPDRRGYSPLDELRALSRIEQLVIGAAAVAAVLGGWLIVLLGFAAGTPR